LPVCQQEKAAGGQFFWDEVTVMVNQEDKSVEDSGEWLIDQVRAMGRRLKKFQPKNMTQDEWAMKIGISSSVLSAAVNGANITMKNFLLIKIWMLKAGYSAEEREWWELGAGKEPRQSSGKKSATNNLHWRTDRNGNCGLNTGLHMPC
jgi:hypothetical protein